MISGISPGQQGPALTDQGLETKDLTDCGACGSQGHGHMAMPMTKGRGLGAKDQGSASLRPHGPFPYVQEPGFRGLHPLFSQFWVFKLYCIISK
jgi:hypothetical protein